MERRIQIRHWEFDPSRLILRIPKENFRGPQVIEYAQAYLNGISYRNFDTGKTTSLEQMLGNLFESYTQLVIAHITKNDDGQSSKEKLEHAMLMAKKVGLDEEYTKKAPQVAKIIYDSYIKQEAHKILSGIYMGGHTGRNNQLRNTSEI